MQTKVLWVIAVILIVGLGIALYALSTDRGAQLESEVTQNTEETTPTENDPVDEEGMFSGTGTLQSLLGMGDSFFCTYTYADQEFGNGEGTGYFDGERMRVEGTYTQNGTAFQTHMINDGTKIYSWSDSAQGSFAFVMDVGDTATDEGSAVQDTETKKGTEALDENVTYECKNWRPDASVFIPPSDINFVDLQAMMQGSFEGMVVPQ